MPMVNITQHNEHPDGQSGVIRASIGPDVLGPDVLGSAEVSKPPRQYEGYYVVHRGRWHCQVFSSEMKWARMMDRWEADKESAIQGIKDYLMGQQYRT